MRWRNGHLGRRVVEVRLPGRHRAAARCIPAIEEHAAHCSIAEQLLAFAGLYAAAREEDLDDLAHSTSCQTRSHRLQLENHMFRLATAALSLTPAMQPLRAGVAMPARALASRAAEKTGPIFDVVFCAN